MELECPQHVPDEQLLELLQDDSRMAFNVLYYRYWEKLYRAAYNVLGEEEASKDIVQEIFLTIWRKRKTQQVKHLSAYLFQSVKFQVAQSLRRGKLQEMHYAQLLPSVYTNSTEELMDFKELQREVKDALRDLPDKCRDIFYMSRFEHLTNSEIASRLNLSPRTVEGHISNALKHLRHTISDIAMIMILIVMIR